MAERSSKDEAGGDRLRHTWRKRLFRAWIAATGLVALYILIGLFFAGPSGPFAAEYVALAEPIFMALLVGGSLIWLAASVLSGGKGESRR